MNKLLPAFLVAGLLSGCASTGSAMPEAADRAERESVTGSNIPRKKGGSVGSQPVTSYDKETAEQARDAALSRQPVGPGS